MCRIDSSPCVNDGQNLDRLQIGKSKVMGFGKGQDVTFTSDRLGSE